MENNTKQLLEKCFQLFWVYSSVVAKKSSEDPSYIQASSNFALIYRGSVDPIRMALESILNTKVPLDPKMNPIVPENYFEPNTWNSVINNWNKNFVEFTKKSEPIKQELIAEINRGEWGTMDLILYWDCLKGVQALTAAMGEFCMNVNHIDGIIQKNVAKEAKIKQPLFGKVQKGQA